MNKFTKKLSDFFANNITALNIAYLLFISFFTIGVLNFENFAEKGIIATFVIIQKH